MQLLSRLLRRKHALAAVMGAPPTVSTPLPNSMLLRSRHALTATCVSHAASSTCLPALHLPLYTCTGGLEERG